MESKVMDNISFERGSCDSCTDFLIKSMYLNLELKLSALAGLGLVERVHEDDWGGGYPEL